MQDIFNDGEFLPHTQNCYFLGCNPKNTVLISNYPIKHLYIS